MILVDAHVHIHDCFDIPSFLNAAVSNFYSQLHVNSDKTETYFFLMLAEQDSVNYFRCFVERAKRNSEKDLTDLSGWSFKLTSDPDAIIAENQLKESSLYIIAGRQIKSFENIEILALGTSGLFSDGQPIAESIEKIRKVQALPVIPWGVGKLLGRRGGIVSDLIRSAENQSLCIGDNSGRPKFWKQSHLFEYAASRSFPVLPGSDPLPFVSEQIRVGSFGCSINGLINPEKPTASIKTLIYQEGSEICPFGQLETLPRFFINQLRMQLKKRSKKIVNLYSNFSQ